MPPMTFMRRRLPSDWRRARIIARATFCVYFAVSVPLRLAFVPSFQVTLHYLSFAIPDLLANLYFILETASLLFRRPDATVVPLEHGYENSDTSKANAASHAAAGKGFRFRARHSLSLEFIFSLVASLPLEYLTLFFSGLTANYFMANRALAVLSLPRYLAEISSTMEETGFLKNIGVHRAWKLFFAMAIAGHWCGCGFFFVAKSQALKGNPFTWPQDIGVYRVQYASSDGAHDIEMLVDVPEAYVQSLYWAYITMITTGFGDIVPLSIPETVWCILSMYIGVIITTCAIANLQLLVTNMDAALTNFQRKVELIKMYMRYRQLPGHLTNRIISFYDYHWDLLKGADEEKFLGELPRSLQQQVANFMCRDLIASLPFLRKANNALLNALAECAEFNLNIYSPNDDILKPGEQIRGVILIARGEVEVIRGTTVERRMQPFDRFAEESLFVKKTSDRFVRAKTFCEAFLLPADEFQHIIKSQCDSNHIAYMKETALTLARSAVKANKMFGSAEEAVTLRGFKKYCHPASMFRKLWALLLFVGLVYYIFAIPLSVMEFFQTSTFADSAILLSLGYAIDLLFLVNTILEFNFFLYLEEGLLVFDQERIRQHFLHTHSLFREVVAVLPIDLLALIPVASRYHHFFRMTKILRIPNIIKYIANVERVLVDFKVGLNQSIARVLKLNFLMIVVCHWVGCLWYTCADVSIRTGAAENWRDADESDETLAISHLDLGGFAGYLRSVYWAIVGMSTVGYGDIVPTNTLETTFAALVILFGGLVLPAVVGGLAAYLGNLNVAIKIHRNKLAKARTYMRNTNMDQTWVDRVLRFYDYLWSRQGGVDEQAVMDELPGPLRQKVAMHVNGSAIESVPFFALCDDMAKQLIVSTLKPKVFLPSDVIAHEGEVGTEMFLIERGQVVVSSKDREIPYCTLGKGDYFGESCLLGATVRFATVTALTYCDCFVLSKHDYNEVMSTCLPPKRQTIDNAVADTVRGKTMRNNSISYNIEHHPKCRKQAVSSCLNEVGVQAPVRTAKYSPGTKFRTLWNAIVLLHCMYNAWCIPFRLAFSPPPIYYMLDWALDTTLLVDAFLNYREFAFIREGELISDRDKVKRHYLSGRFKADTIAIVPLDSVAFVALSGRSDLALIMAFLRIPKLVRLGRLPSLLADIFRALEDTSLSLAPIRLVEFLLGVILIAHWAACGFYAFARWKNDGAGCLGLDDGSSVVDWANEYSECRWVDTWIQRQVINGKLPIEGGGLWQLYIRSFNWALPTLVVVVIGDVTPVTSAETFYAFVWMVVGVTLNAAIIGNVANIVANLETDSAEFLERSDAIKSFLHRNHLGNDLQERVDQFMTYLWATHGGMANEADFIQALPYTLQLDLTRSRQRHIRNCPFFDFCSDDIIKALTLCLKLRIFSVGDILAHADDMGQEMFFLERGSVEVLSTDGKTVFATLMSGCFFGETSLFFKQKRSSSIRAASFCEVFQLDKSDLDNELKQRDFDLSRMLDAFTAIAQSNKRRNTAVAANLAASKLEHTKLHKIINASDSMVAHGRRIRKIYLPNSPFRACWDIASLVFTIYFAISVPYRVAFVQEDPSDRTAAWLLMDFAIDGFFVLDIYLRCFHFAFIQNGTVVTDKDAIRSNYRTNEMSLDVFSCLPLEILAVWCGFQRIRFMRLVHLFRAFRLPSYSTRLDTYLTLWNVRVSGASELLVKMFFYYVLVNHWCACVWFIIHRYLERNVQYTWATSDCVEGGNVAGDGCLAAWDEALGEHNVCNSDSMSTCYIRSIYFVITTISTVGYGDIAPVTEVETIWENVVVLTGACFFAGIIGAFSAYLSQNDTAGSNAFKLKMQKLQEYMACRKLPSQLQDEILLFHKHKWDQSHVLDKRAIMSILPLPLQMDLSFAVTRQVIGQIPILNSCHDILQKRIAHALTLQVCPPGSNIYTVGDIGWDLYFIGRGVVKITLPSDLSVLDAAGRANAARLKRKQESIGVLYRPGNHFGESCLMSESGVRQETAVAKRSADLYLITKEDLERIWRYMAPQERDTFKTNLLCKNGNAWHTFEGDDEPVPAPNGGACGDGNEAASTSPLSQFRTSYLGQKPSKRFSSLPYKRQRTVARPTKGSHDERLRSFSAEAINQMDGDEKEGSTNERELPRCHSAALAVQRLVQTGALTVHTEQSGDSSSFEDT